MPVPQVIHEPSFDFQAISARLKNASGLGYPEFRRTLKPRYGKVWADILLGYAGFALIGTALALGPFSAWPVGLGAAVLGGIGFGFLHHYLALFIHEASHHNLTASRRLNDRAANVFLGVLQGYSIETYRPTHFGHHREFGSPEDPEHHYFHALDFGLVLRTLSGIRAINAASERLFRAKSAGSRPPPGGIQY